MLFALEDVVEPGQDLLRTSHVCARQCASANYVGNGDRQERRIETVTGDIDKIEREMIVIHPVIADRITTERGGRQIPPIYGN